MERVKGPDRTTQTIERIKEVIDRSVGAEIPHWAIQLHEVPFQNNVRLSHLYYSDFSASGKFDSRQFDTFLRKDALGKRDSLGSEGIREIRDVIKKLTITVEDPLRRHPRTANSLTIGDIRTLKDGFIRRLGLSPLHVFISRKLFGYELEGGLDPRAWTRNLEGIGLHAQTKNHQLKKYFNGVYRKPLSKMLDSDLPNNVRYVGKKIIFETLRMISFPTVKRQSVDADVMGSSLPLLLGEGLLDEIDGLDTVTRKTIILRLLC